MHPRGDAERFVHDIVDRMHRGRFELVALMVAPELQERYDEQSLKATWSTLGPKLEKTQMLRARATQFMHDDGNVGLFGDARFSLKRGTATLRVEAGCQQSDGPAKRCLPPYKIELLVMERD